MFLYLLESSCPNSCDTSLLLNATITSILLNPSRPNDLLKGFENLLNCCSWRDHDPVQQHHQPIFQKRYFGTFASKHVEAHTEFLLRCRKKGRASESAVL